jgi:hypothetical protein
VFPEVQDKGAAVIGMWHQFFGQQHGAGVPAGAVGPSCCGTHMPGRTHAGKRASDAPIAPGGTIPDPALPAQFLDRAQADIEGVP